MNFCRAPDPGIRAALLFGTDRGAVAEAAQQLTESWIGEDRAGVTYLHDGNLDQLDNAVASFSLFGSGPTLAHIRLENERSATHILRALEAQEKGASTGYWLIEAGNLLPKSRLRKAFASAASAKSIEIAGDSIEDTQTMIRNALKDAIDDDAIALAADLLVGNRALARSEIAKMSLYAIELERRLTIDDVGALLMTVQGKNANLAVDAALGGDMATADRALQCFFEAGGSAVSVLRSAYFRLLRLLAAHNGGKWLRPPVSAADRPGFGIALKRWTLGRIVRAMDALRIAELNCRKLSQADTAIVKSLLLDLARRNV